MEPLFCTVCQRKPARYRCGGGCAVAFYCSQACGEQDWAEGHDVTCRIGSHLTPLSADAIDRYARALVTDGVVVLPVWDTAEEQQSNNASMRAALAALPEYLPGAQQYAKSAFGTLGTASSFHNRFVRRLRQEAMLKAVPLFGRVRQLEATILETPERTPERRLEQIVDRMRVLQPGAKLTGESWHRDLTPARYVTPGDSIFGGWINLDLALSTPYAYMGAAGTQYFSCFPQSHRLDPLSEYWTPKPPTTATMNATGFDKFNSAEAEQLDAMKAARLVGIGTGPRYQQVAIPPGHMLIFYQELVHEVMSIKYKERTPSYRLFTAWRLTASTEPFEPTNATRYFRQMAVPRLKSDQPVPMWSRFGNWNKAAAPGLERWSKETFRPQLLVDEPDLFADDPTRAPIKVTRVPLYMPNLYEVYEKIGQPFDLSAYPPYDEAELAIYRPSTTWTIDSRVLKL